MGIIDILIDNTYTFIKLIMGLICIIYLIFIINKITNETNKLHGFQTKNYIQYMNESTEEKEMNSIYLINK